MKGATKMHTLRSRCKNKKPHEFHYQAVDKGRQNKEYKEFYVYKCFICEKWHSSLRSQGAPKYILDEAKAQILNGNGDFIERISRKKTIWIVPTLIGSLKVIHTKGKECRRFLSYSTCLLVNSSGKVIID